MLLAKLRRGLLSGFLPLLFFLRIPNQPMVSQSKSEPARTATAKENWVKQTLTGSPSRRKWGRLVMPAFRAVYLHSQSPEFREIERQLKRNQVGGYILFAGDVYEAAAAD